MSKLTSSANPAPEAGAVTPMMAQYIEIKAANPDVLLFYRMGDFYELFFDDAEAASRALGLVLTKRGKHMGDDIPMCGVPVDRADDYLVRLIRAGFKVAVAEQMEDPAEARKRGSKSVVKRDVVRLITPGTLLEDALLTPTEANVLAGLAPDPDHKDRYALAIADVSTGHLSLEMTTLAQLPHDLARHALRELVVLESFLSNGAFKQLMDHHEARLAPVLSPLPDGLARPAEAQRRLEAYFGVSTLDGLAFSCAAEQHAALVLIAYLERTLMGSADVLQPPVRQRHARVVHMDASTRSHLEVLSTQKGTVQGSLLSVVDRTLSAAGARLLAQRLSTPLATLPPLQERFDLVETLLHQRDFTRHLRDVLKQLPDVERSLTRLQANKGGPRDLVALRQFLTQAIGLKLPADTPSLHEVAAAYAVLPLHLHETLHDALDVEVPLNAREGGFIRIGYDHDLDALRLLAKDSRQAIAALQAQLMQATGLKSLKVKHNQFLGYFVEVPLKDGEVLRQHCAFVHRQTMSDAMRFSTPELADLNQRIVDAHSQSVQLETALFDDLRTMALAQAGRVREMAQALAALDVAQSTAVLAEQERYVRPVVDESLTFRVKGGRHPVVEAALKARGEPFIANDTDLSARVNGEAGQLKLMTGPNMGGKSTYLRQNALLVVLAQAGLYVPATQAHLGLVDQLFTRVGASDDLAGGRSTFMVEMVETAAILNRATERSLVVLDEIGRGTSTLDGLALAQACLEHLHHVVKARGLFATHFHELTELSATLPRLGLLTLNVMTEGQKIIFLHEVCEGVADRSYGVHVARLAGLPAPVLKRARERLQALETQAQHARLLESDGALLPLFQPPSTSTTRSVHPALETLVEVLAKTDPDRLSPREALDVLYQLRGLLSEGDNVF